MGSPRSDWPLRSRTFQIAGTADDDDDDAAVKTFGARAWVPLSEVGSSQFVGICSLPGCRYKDIRRSLHKDVEELHNQGVQDVFVLCTRGELSKYRVPSLLEVYQQKGLCVHHMPFPDGEAPQLEQCAHILDELQRSLEANRRTLIHCYGGLGRSALIAACLLIQLSVTMTANEAINILRAHRGHGAIQTIKQYNFLHEFRESYTAYQESRAIHTERCVSR
ncbi:cyclin-dependent kinase inhibitor 3 isoform X2 [Phyllopteryx taeniolatus]|uniref:cyclin-dependent kinase inhibitor 3 isoform X2 n=1 Tax=Phyllopteryx taeniolatus TaxID=161469 RepID=UPI002AD21B71|nr:cyclin-dependent kinase inhibitor 3 isoform X2 [Phyllopteryx taeniolatus]